MASALHKQSFVPDASLGTPGGHIADRERELIVALLLLPIVAVLSAGLDCQSAVYTAYYVHIICTTARIVSGGCKSLLISMLASEAITTVKSHGSEVICSKQYLISSCAWQQGLFLTTCLAVCVHWAVCCLLLSCSSKPSTLRISRTYGSCWQLSLSTFQAGQLRA